MPTVKVTLGNCTYAPILANIIEGYMAGDSDRWIVTLVNKKAVWVRDLSNQQAERLSQRVRDQKGQAEILPDPVENYPPMHFFGVILEPVCLIPPSILAGIVGGDHGDVCARLRIANGNLKGKPSKPRPVFIVFGLEESQANTIATAINQQGGKAGVHQYV